MDTAFFHHICINVLYGFLVLITFVLLERLVYYLLLKVRSRKIGSAIRKSSLSAAAAPAITGGDEVSRSLAEYIAVQNEARITRCRVEDLSSALFLRVNGRVNARLWILDTAVTAAPLLGLLGTILGIMDTFNALSSGGISDPAAVSRGIAAALLATAIGIGTALYGLLGYNVLHRQAEVIGEDFKRFLLMTTR
jgi:biopolymer transport protein ExbB